MGEKDSKKSKVKKSKIKKDKNKSKQDKKDTTKKKKPNKCWQILLKIRSIFWPITCNYPIYRIFFKIVSFILIFYFLLFFVYLGVLRRNRYWSEVADLPTHSYPQNRMWPGMSILDDRDYEYEGQTNDMKNKKRRRPQKPFTGQPDGWATRMNVTTKNPLI